MTANVTLPAPNVLTDAGFLLFAPLGTAEPANTVAGGLFTDPWPIAWIPLGRTSSGTKISDNATSSDLESAEDYMPLDSRTTKRVVTASFDLLTFTASNLARALNNAVKTVTGATVTSLTQVDAPDPQAETAFMLGYESLDSTVRWIGRTCRNSGDLSVQFAKAPNMAMIPFTANVVKGVSTTPAYSWFFAGDGRG